MAQTLEVQIQHVEGTTSRATARIHDVFVDRPLAKGGTDRGPLGGEHFLIGLGGCFMSTLLATIRAREAAISNVRIRVSAVIDGPPDRFLSFRIVVRARCEDRELAQKLITIAERACIVINTLRDHTPIEISFATD
jgi:putative redox protein